eukprot:CAMPEP_0183477874 /NCGR_PEP_ID=MMETSP0370-20130417/168940_1 /TAXON_ID=268820 /ORGANISM="Peridinium aciculiferum, Strain PAER-2" /LENGTH=33 /DNA_ID= /DNA_START= /DNA_END= /DNA_ORIENTATION=
MSSAVQSRASPSPCLLGGSRTWPAPSSPSSSPS